MPTEKKERRKTGKSAELSLMRRSFLTAGKVVLFSAIQKKQFRLVTVPGPDAKTRKKHDINLVMYL